MVETGGREKERERVVKGGALWSWLRSFGFVGGAC